MIRKLLVVAALLLTGLTELVAEHEAIAAVENSEQHSKNAQKVLIILKNLGISDPDIKDFIDRVDSRSHDGYLHLTEEKAMGGKFELKYELDSRVSARQLQLTYTPNESRVQAIARTDGITVNYHLRF